eukprot:CAMPEP_0172436030 /NCGR_PEP_ID=MMETSP1064-20121228/71508_1 /TAXON_ID=202472 /ORGANISM="Aulacoseira subarctica , Strain CCAP 1002/5" /LENGTH=378 /DNA_ID=CAMNT_0013184409 /DNA_START=75 /DNA_END=1212 /DNA_ORIENTATION=-
MISKFPIDQPTTRDEKSDALFADTHVCGWVNIEYTIRDETISNRSQDASDDVEDENRLWEASTKLTDYNEKNNIANKENNIYVTLSVKDKGKKALIAETVTGGCHKDNSSSHADDDSWTTLCTIMCFDINEAIWQENSISMHEEDSEKDQFMKLSWDQPKTRDKKSYAFFADTCFRRELTSDDIEDEKHIWAAHTKFSNNDNNANKENGKYPVNCVKDQEEKALISDTVTGRCLEDSSNSDVAKMCFDIEDVLITQEGGTIASRQDDWPTSFHRTNDALFVGTSICGWADVCDTAWNQLTSHLYQDAFKDMEDQIQSTELSKTNNNLKENIKFPALSVKDQTEKALADAETFTIWHRKDNYGSFLHNNGKVSIEFCER